MKLGIETLFKKVNEKNGINGNIIKLIHYDDDYESGQCSENMIKLIDVDNVLAVIGNVGTPTAAIAVPIANEKKTLLFGSFTGSGLLRKSPPDRYIINYRASYGEETGAMISGLIKLGVAPDKIAFFTQNDAYGDEGYQGAIKALKDKGYKNVDALAHGRYRRNTTNVEDAVVVVAAAMPQAVIMVGSYKPCAKFIKLAKEFLPDAIYLNVSLVGSIPLAKELGELGEGVVVTQVVPHFESDLPGVKEYRKNFAKYAPGKPLGFVSLEGYIVAKIFAEGLKNAGDNPTRESVIDSIESLSGFDIGMNAPINYSKTEHQASHKVWPTIIRNTIFMPLKWEDLTFYCPPEDKRRGLNHKEEIE